MYETIILPCVEESEKPICKGRPCHFRMTVTRIPPPSNEPPPSSYERLFLRIETDESWESEKDCTEEITFESDSNEGDSNELERRFCCTPLVGGVLPLPRVTLFHQFRPEDEVTETGDESERGTSLVELSRDDVICRSLGEMMVVSENMVTDV